MAHPRHAIHHQPVDHIEITVKQVQITVHGHSIQHPSYSNECCSLAGVDHQLAQRPSVHIPVAGSRVEFQSSTAAIQRPGHLYCSTAARDRSQVTQPKGTVEIEDRV